MTAAKRWDKWHDGVVEGAERFMVEWHQQVEAKRCARHAKEVARGTRDRRGAGRIDNDTIYDNSSSIVLQLTRVRTRWRIGWQGSRWTNFGGNLELPVS